MAGGAKQFVYDARGKPLATSVAGKMPLRGVSYPGHAAMI
jgi:hypothetical protein